MKSMRYILTLVILLQAVAGFSQLILKRANKEYDQLRFANAAELYEQAVIAGHGSNELYVKIADCYYKIKDLPNAEKYYKKAVKGNLTENDQYQYIQSMLQNGKVFEAIDIAKQYNTTSKRILNIASTDVSKILADSVVNTLHFLDFNTPFSDFSPAVYDKGLVFVSARHKGNLHKNVFGWNNTPFLNLYYVDTTGLNKNIHDHEIKREDFVHYEEPHLYVYGSKLHADETRRTGNDSHTAGYYSTYFRKNEDDTIYFKHDVTLFNATFNTKYHEGPVTFNAAQDLIIFTRNNFHEGDMKRSDEDVNHLNMYLAKKTAGVWGNPEPLPFNNDHYSVGHPTFDSKEEYVYFASDMPGGFGGSDLYKVSYSNGTWGTPENLGDKINTDGNELFPFISENILFFASDGHGGLGGLDVIAMNLKNLSQEKNLGYPINTHKDDFGFIIDKSGKEGFVSSNRHRTGLDDDIFEFSRTKPVVFTNPIEVLVVDRITELPIPSANVIPQHMIEPCITNEKGECVFDAEPGNTYTFIGKKEKYLDGNASIELKQEDIHGAKVKMYLHELGNSLYFKVTDRNTELPLKDVKIRVTNQFDRKLIIERYTSEAGELRKLLESTKVNDVLNYLVRFEHAGYLSKELDLRHKILKPGEIQVHEYLDAKMDKVDLGMDVGKVIHLNPIYFDLNKYNIRKDAAEELDKMVKVMKDNPDMIIELGSHTDCRSSAAYNMRLSELRAQASAQYIISKGIEKSRIYGRGYGETKLVNDCGCEAPVTSTCSEEEHQLNRRTEFIIVKM
jgi:outer membrane protein OmpA-like peptidoglycan-associated protein/tetratricopeptide (TPR) repeat protein